MSHTSSANYFFRLCPGFSDDDNCPYLVKANCQALLPKPNTNYRASPVSRHACLLPT